MEDLISLFKDTKISGICQVLFFAGNGSIWLCADVSLLTELFVSVFLGYKQFAPTGAHLGKSRRDVLFVDHEKNERKTPIGVTYIHSTFGKSK